MWKTFRVPGRHPKEQGNRKGNCSIAGVDPNPIQRNRHEWDDDDSDEERLDSASDGVWGW